MQVKFGSRRLQFINGSAFLNVPRSWVRTLRLQRGDLLVIDLLEDGSLKISPMLGEV